MELGGLWYTNVLNSALPLRGTGLTPGRSTKTLSATQLSRKGRKKKRNRKREREGGRERGKEGGREEGRKERKKENKFLKIKKNCF